MRSATLKVAQAHADGNQSEEDAVLASAGAPGEAGNVIACAIPPLLCQMCTAEWSQGLAAVAAYLRVSEPAGLLTSVYAIV